jgi:hypothetical protein
MPFPPGYKVVDLGKDAMYILLNDWLNVLVGHQELGN